MKGCTRSKVLTGILSCLVVSFAQLSDGETVFVLKGATTTPGLEAFPATGLLSGTISSAETGTPIAGARIGVLEEQRLVRAAETNENGQFFFKTLAGTFSIYIEAEGFVTRFFEDVEIVEDLTTFRNINLLLDRSTGASVISGAIRIANSDRFIREVAVRLTSPLGIDRVSSIFTGDTFSFGRLPIGNFIVSVSVAGFEIKEIAITLGPSEAKSIEFEAEPKGFPATILGVSRDFGGSLVIGMNVKLAAMFRSLEFNTKTTNSGEYIFVNVPEEIYEITGSGGDFAEAFLDGLELAAGSTTQIDFTMGLAESEVGSPSNGGGCGAQSISDARADYPFSADIMLLALCAATLYAVGRRVKA